MSEMKRKNWKDFLRLETNFVIRTLTIADVFILFGFGLVGPIFAIFLTENIKGGSVEVVGIASMIYLITKSLGQLPVAQVIDKIKGERDDFWTMVVGSIGISSVPLLYLLARVPLHVYIIQFIYGLSQAMVFPSWMAIFTRHIEPEKEGIAWGLYYTLIDLSSAGAALLGGIIAKNMGFAPLFIAVSTISLFGSSWLMLVYKEMKKK